ncbi:FHA domain-containing protein [Rathayibacter sp. YIM 133350]|uniref:FHA domain-containing protein n=1 Tax=Rathayibacter sp. YIM 133350 TaxID=3131992 RepID=UPI00307DCEA3
MQIDYEPDAAGEWLAIVAPSRVIVLRPGEADVAGLHRLMLGDAAPGAVIEALATSGLSSIPPFALVAEEPGGLRVIVRGAVDVVADVDGRSQTFSGRTFSTWAESVVAATSARVTTGRPAGGASLPLLSGAAWAAGVHIAVGNAEPEQRELDDSTVVVPRPASGARSDALLETPGPAPEVTVVDIDREAEPVASIDEAGDHDGQTVLSDQLRDVIGRARAERGTTPQQQPPEAAGYGLRLPDGRIERVETAVLIGRAPSLSQHSGGPVPRLLAIGGADNDISRNHVHVELQGDTLVATDLHSRNGTILTLPGTEPRKLRAGEAATVVAGSVIDLGGGITIAVETSPA